jgi:pimeloyl-ACP methyl ester carboxylesterase
MEKIALTDGRALEYLDLGDPDGRPVVYLHGTPGTAGCAALLDEAARRRAVRLVAVSRPGYGASTTSVPGLSSVARDVGELVSTLGIGELAVWGTSGGGPYALAVGALLPDLVTRIAVAAGPAPYQQVAPEVLDAEDVRALELLASGDADGAVAQVMPGVRRAFDAVHRLPPGEFAEAFAGMAPANEDYFDSRPAEGATMFADVHRALERYDGLIRDNLSWLGPWDVELGAVAAPTALHYGQTDAMVPTVHGEWLDARLPTAVLTIHAGAGHGDITFGLAEEILSALH